MENSNESQYEIKSPFIFNEPVIPPLFAGRKIEIGGITRALFEN